jgi:DNA polymerase III alpha subunit
MKSTAFGEIILSEQDLFDGIYSGKITDLGTIFLDNPAICTKILESVQKNADRVAVCKVWLEPTETMQEWDKKNQEQWFMPQEYSEMDIELFLLEQCTTVEEQDRVALELDLYHQHNFISVLKYLKYLVDTMRSNNIVWGVGRGSSVASYCLYLLGVHKVNSIKYELDIHEFLK